MEDTFKKLARFVLVGAFCAGVFFVVNYVLLQVVALSFAFALLLTYAICIGLGYVLQRNVAFKATGGHRRSLLRYLALQSAAMLFVYSATPLLRPVVGSGSLGASLVTTGLAGVASFFVLLTWVFVPALEEKVHRSVSGVEDDALCS